MKDVQANPDAIDYENEPTKKAEAINNIVRSISLVNDIIKRELYVQTCSKIMKDNVRAVDVVAYFGSDISWELNVYDDICDAFAEAARRNSVAIKWGAAWSEGDIRMYQGTAEDAMNAYIDLRRSQGRRPFIDAPHFEMI